MASFRPALTEARQPTQAPADRPVNSEPRPCRFDVGFPLSGPQDRTSTSDLTRHARRTAARLRLAPANRSRPRCSCSPASQQTPVLALKHSRNVLLTVSHELGKEGVENKHDVKLSTLERYVNALGGRLAIHAIFDDADIVLIGAEDQSPDKT
jgi:hypothetical protein